MRGCVPVELVGKGQPPGARASRPQNAWHNPAHLRHSDRPGTAPWVSLGPVVAVHADRVAACKVALTLSDLHKK